MSDFVVGSAAQLTYGLTNRLFARGKNVDDARGQTREFLTVGLQQTYYTNPTRRATTARTRAPSGTVSSAIDRRSR